MPAGRLAGEPRREPPPEGARHRAVRHAEGVERVGVRGQHVDAALHAVRRGPGPAQQFRRGLTPCVRRRARRRDRQGGLDGGQQVLARGARRRTRRRWFAAPVAGPAGGVRRRARRRGRQGGLDGGQRVPAPCVRRRARCRPRLDPGAVPRHQGPERGLGGPPVRQRPQRVHRQLGAGYGRGRRPFDVGPGDPRRAQRPAGAVHDLPVRRHAVAGRVLGSVGVVEVGHPVVPVHRPRPARVGPGHERPPAADLDLGLEGVGAVRFPVVRRTPVHQKDRHRPRPRRNAGEPAGVQRPLVHVEREASGIGHVALAAPGRAAARERRPHRPLVRPPPPDRFRLPAGALDLRVLVVAPADRHVQRVRLRRDEEAQPHRRRQEALPRRPALFRRLFREAPRLRRLVDVVVLVRVGAPLRLRARRNQEPGQIPVRRAHPAGQPLGRERLARPRTDQVEAQRLGQPPAHLRGVRARPRRLLPRHGFRSTPGRVRTAP